MSMSGGREYSLDRDGDSPGDGTGVVLHPVVGSIAEEDTEGNTSLEGSGDESSKVGRGGLSLVDWDESREGSDSVPGEDTSSDDLSVAGGGSGLDGDSWKGEKKEKGREASVSVFVHPFSSPALVEAKILTDHEDEEGDEVGVPETDSSLGGKKGRKCEVSQSKDPTRRNVLFRATHSDVAGDEGSDEASDGEDTGDDRLPLRGDSADSLNTGSESG